MQLWLVRHAVAADRDEFAGPDADRPLTDKGRRQFRRFVDRLAEAVSAPASRIVTSPLVRAVETADILRQGLGLRKKDVSIADALAPGAHAATLCELAGDANGAPVAFVGHEPDFSRALADLLGGGEFTFGKGHVAAVDFEGAPAVGAGALRWFVGPRW